MDLNECRTANGSHVSHFKLNQTPLEERNICCVLLKTIECLNETSGVSPNHCSRRPVQKCVLFNENISAMVMVFAELTCMVSEKNIH